MFILGQTLMEVLKHVNLYIRIEKTNVRLPKGPVKGFRGRTERLSRYCLGNVNRVRQIMPRQFTEALLMGSHRWKLILVKAQTKNNLIPKRQKQQTVHRWANVALMPDLRCRLQLLPCTLSNYRVNGKFNPRANLTLGGLSNYFWVYLVG